MLLFLLLFFSEVKLIQKQEKTSDPYPIGSACHQSQRCISSLHWQDEHYILEMVFW